MDYRELFRVAKTLQYFKKNFFSDGQSSDGRAIKLEGGGVMSLMYGHFLRLP